MCKVADMYVFTIVARRRRRRRRRRRSSVFITADSDKCVVWKSQCANLQFVCNFVGFHFSWCRAISVAGCGCREEKRLSLKCVCCTRSPQARCWCRPSAKSARSCTCLGYLSLYLSLLLVLTHSLLLSDTKLNVEKPKCLSFSMSVQRFCHRKKIHGCRGNRSYWDSWQLFLGWWCDVVCLLLFFCHAGVMDMYVHVLANNQAALMLYTKGGFLYENEEMTVSSHARMQLRPHCLLLHKRIQKLKST